MQCAKKFAKNKKILKGQSVRKIFNNKKFLNDRYEAERSGDIQIDKDEAKILEPLIKSQQETSKATQDKIVESSDFTNNALVPFITELRKRNEQVDTLQKFRITKRRYINHQYLLPNQRRRKKNTMLFNYINL